jgi:hypothetical protein
LKEVAPGIFRELLKDHPINHLSILDEKVENKQESSKTIEVAK